MIMQKIRDGPGGIKSLAGLW